uniref:Uncharacterized protein n=1 Tax=Rhizophora mucronata TaxID=61149 RepID=A0A2P2QU25_RHIMU
MTWKNYKNSKKSST